MILLTAPGKRVIRPDFACDARVQEVTFILKAVFGFYDPEQINTYGDFQYHEHYLRRSRTVHMGKCILGFAGIGFMA